MKILGLVLACGMLGTSVNAVMERIDPQVIRDEGEKCRREFVETADRLIADIEARRQPAAAEPTAQLADRVISAIGNIRRAGLHIEAGWPAYYGCSSYKSMISMLHSFFLRVEGTPDAPRIQEEGLHEDENLEQMRDLQSTQHHLRLHEDENLEQMRDATSAAIQDIDEIARSVGDDSLVGAHPYPVSSDSPYMPYQRFSDITSGLYDQYMRQAHSPQGEGH